MNRSFFAIVKLIVYEQGESILADPDRLKSYISDLARNEPKEDRLAFGRAIQHGFYMHLKNASPADRPRIKAHLLPHLQTITGFDTGRCKAAIDLLDAVIAPLAVTQPPPHNPKKSNTIRNLLVAAAVVTVFIFILIRSPQTRPSLVGTWEFSHEPGLWIRFDRDGSGHRMWGLLYVGRNGNLSWAILPSGELRITIDGLLGPITEVWNFEFSNNGQTLDLRRPSVLTGEEVRYRYFRR